MYAVGTAVQIWPGETVWLSGVVVAHQPPGLWVQTADGRSWFVTNRRRIRPEESDGKDVKDTEK